MKAHRRTARPPRPEAREFASFAELTAAFVAWVLAPYRNPTERQIAAAETMAAGKAADAWGMR